MTGIDNTTLFLVIVGVFVGVSVFTAALAYMRYGMLKKRNKLLEKRVDLLVTALRLYLDPLAKRVNDLTEKCNANNRTDEIPKFKVDDDCPTPGVA